MTARQYFTQICKYFVTQSPFLKLFFHVTYCLISNILICLYGPLTREIIYISTVLQRICLLYVWTFQERRNNWTRMVSKSMGKTHLLYCPHQCCNNKISFLYLFTLFSFFYTFYHGP